MATQKINALRSIKRSLSISLFKKAGSGSSGPTGSGNVADHSAIYPNDLSSSTGINGGNVACADGQGFFYTCDGASIYKYDTDGNQQESVSPTLGTFFKNFAASQDGSRVAIPDYDNDTLRVYDGSLSLVGTKSIGGAYVVAFDGSTNLYCFGFSNSELFKYDKDLNEQFSSTTPDGRTLAADHSGSFYMSDSNGNVRKYDQSDGSELDAYNPGGGTAKGLAARQDGSYILVAEFERVRKLDSSMSLTWDTGTLRSGTQFEAIGFDPDDNVFALSDVSEMIKLDPDGNELASTSANTGNEIGVDNGVGG